MKRPAPREDPPPPSPAEIIAAGERLIRRIERLKRVLRQMMKSQRKP